MNIYAKNGHKVIYTGATDDQVHGAYGGGHDPRGLLIEKAVYTVDHTVVGSWRTMVYFQEFPHLYFNSVLFEDEKK